MRVYFEARAWWEVKGCRRLRSSCLQSRRAGPIITGPMFFALATHHRSARSIAFTLPGRYFEKSSFWHEM